MPLNCNYEYCTETHTERKLIYAQNSYRSMKTFPLLQRGIRHENYAKLRFSFAQVCRHFLHSFTSEEEKKHTYMHTCTVVFYGASERNS